MGLSVPPLQQLHLAHLAHSVPEGRWGLSVLLALLLQRLRSARLARLIPEDRWGLSVLMVQSLQLLHSARSVPEGL